jgi:hypothetical protein
VESCMNTGSWLIHSSTSAYIEPHHVRRTPLKVWSDEQLRRSS